MSDRRPSPIISLRQAPLPVRSYCTRPQVVVLPVYGYGKGVQALPLRRLQLAVPWQH